MNSAVSLSGPMIEQMGKQVEKGFNDCALGLKARAEELYRSGKN